MKNSINKKYFLFTLKKHIPACLLIFIVFIITYIVPLLLSLDEQYNMSDEKYFYASTMYGGIVTLLAVFGFILPMNSFDFITRKNHFDTYYSLPIDRMSLSIIHILVKLIITIIPFTVVYFVGSLITIIILPELLYIYYIELYFILIVSYIFYFMFNTFFFTRNNRNVDGFVATLFANFALAGIVYVVLLLLKESEITKLNAVQEFDFKYALYFIPFISFVMYGNYYNDLILAKYNYHDYVVRATHSNKDIKQYSIWFQETYKFDLLYLIVLIIIAVTAIILFLILEKKRKPENAGEISNSKFGLTTLNPILFSILTIICSYGTSFSISFIFFNFISISYFIVLLAEYRSFKVPLYKILIIPGMFLLTFIK